MGPDGIFPGLDPLIQTSRLLRRRYSRTFGTLSRESNERVREGMVWVVSSETEAVLGGSRPLSW